MKMMTNDEFAIITPSYGPDFERCRLLARSVEWHVAEPTRHFVLVEHRDWKRFKTLAGPRTEIVPVEEFVPSWLHRLPFSNNFLLSTRTRPVRNWIWQQLVKLSVAEHIDADVLLFVDSDVLFVRDFEASSLVRDGRTRMFRAPGAAQLETHFRWHRSAAQLLGLEERDYFGADYIGDIISWRSDHVRAMHRRIEAATGTSWQRAIARTWHLSEYILYGIFVDQLLDGGSHYHTDEGLCQISWNYQVDDLKSLERVFLEVRPEHVAVMVDAKLGIPAAHYEPLLATVPS
jgi:hypothetical protein